MKIVSGLALIAGGISVVFVMRLGHGLMTGGFDGDAGMASLFFMLYGALFAMGAILFGIIAFMLARRKGLPMPRLGKFGFGMGVLSALVIIALNAFG